MALGMGGNYRDEVLWVLLAAVVGLEKSSTVTADGGAVVGTMVVVYQAAAAAVLVAVAVMRHGDKAGNVDNDDRDGKDEVDSHGARLAAKSHNQPSRHSSTAVTLGVPS